MITISELREKLSIYPSDASVYAYEGEVRGLVVVQGDDQLGVIVCGETDEEDAASRRALSGEREGEPCT